MVSRRGLSLDPSAALALWLYDVPIIAVGSNIIAVEELNHPRQANEVFPEQDYFQIRFSYVPAQMRIYKAKERVE